MNRSNVFSNRYEPVIIDVESTDTRLVEYRIRSAKKNSAQSFVVGVIVDGAKMTYKFMIWTLKNMIMLIGISLKAAADGNREMNEEIRRSKYIESGRTLKRRNG